MPEFFLELFSEEIPARMQAAAWQDLTKICTTVFSALNPKVDQYDSYGPRRLAFSARIEAATDSVIFEVRGPKVAAPETAVQGFARKHNANVAELSQEDGYFVLRKTEQSRNAADVILEDLPKALAKFYWPKSMRWGQGGDFTWVRPLRRVVCILDGQIVPIRLGPIVAGNETEGHRFLSAGTLVVASYEQWTMSLEERYVIPSATNRRIRIDKELKAAAKKLDLSVVDDQQLLNEVTGLVEWPVALIGKIDKDFMGLPPEVRELSMKVNQRYFALRDYLGRPAPYFAFVSNIEAKDGGTAIVSGNERVLRARLSDAKHFWSNDIKIPLIRLLPKLEGVTFHAKLGSQRARVDRLIRGSFMIGSRLGADTEHCRRAAELSKCDLLSGMVGEFPELQGIIGGYYAESQGEPGDVVQALKAQYSPKGPKDEVPKGPVAISLAIADKLDQIVAFFDVGERPTGSGDPYALRRAALGVIRIIIENEIDLELKSLIHDALESVRTEPAIKMSDQELEADIFEFILDRLRVKLRTEGYRFDTFDAVVEKSENGNLLNVVRCMEALEWFALSDVGEAVLESYRRAANILRIEDSKDGPHTGAPDASLFGLEEAELCKGLERLPAISFIFSGSLKIRPVSAGDFKAALEALAELRSPLAEFFQNVTVNSPQPELRRNRLRLLAQLRDTMHQIADFSKIEG